MRKPRIHFTVSMWNRRRHLEQLLLNLQEIVGVDPEIALHVCFFWGDDWDVDDACRAVEAMTFPTRFVSKNQEFNNGLGHNLAAEGVPEEDILCAITVDLAMPLDITDRIRCSTLQGEYFFAPRVNCEDEAGALRRCEHAYALVAVFKEDFTLLVGQFAQNRKWGGDNDENPEGGEDKVLCNQLRAGGLREVRQYQPDVVCRWHPRDITSEFYSSLKRYKKKPWWTFRDAAGQELQF